MKENKPLVSYVLTAYNIENFIEESVKCAFAQTYEPLEIILSDDCSTDKTFEIMKKMADEYKGPHKVILNRNEKNLGITKHMNKAYLELAHGEIIVAAHGDDISAPERTSIVADYLINHSECTQVACGAVVVNKDLTPLPKIEQKNLSVNEIRTYHFGSGAHLSVGFSAFRKNVMHFFGPLGDSCPTEDDAIGFRAIILGELVFLPNIIIKYRKHENSNSNPDQFYRFPLDEIYNQNLKDMNYAVSSGIISQQQANREQERLYKSKELRKVYRNYFANRTFLSWIKLVLYKDIGLRMRLHYIREHLEYLKNR